jgi:predicted dehydrogenase
VRTVNRRNLLKIGGAGIVLPTFVPRHVLGGQNHTPPSERVLVGHIGVRNQGRANLRPHLQHTAALCDVDSEVLGAAHAEVQEKTGRSCRTYDDYRRLLDDPDVDAAVVSTPDHWHALMTIHACQAGKDVYVEKPLTLTIDEGKAIVRAARRHNRIVQTGSQQRSDGRFRRACELVRNGRIGNVHTVRVGLPGPNFRGPAQPDAAPPGTLNYDLWLGPAPYRPFNELRTHYWFRFFWDYSGGQMTNWGAHHLDIAQWGLGMDDSGPIAATGSARFHPQGWYETPEWFEVTYEYPGGLRLICGNDQRGGTTFEGTGGSIWVDRGKLEASDPAIVQDPLPEGAERLYESGDHHRNWLDCIHTRQAPICSAEIGHRSATVCHLGNIAIRSGRPVRWDPRRERLLGDREQTALTGYAYRAPWTLPG